MIDRMILGRPRTSSGSFPWRDGAIPESAVDRAQQIPVKGVCQARLDSLRSSLRGAHR